MLGRVRETRRYGREWHFIRRSTLQPGAVDTSLLISGGEADHSISIVGNCRQSAGVPVGWCCSRLACLEQSSKTNDSLSVHPPFRVLLLDALFRSLGQSDDRVGLASSQREDVDLTAKGPEGFVERSRCRPPRIADELSVVELCRMVNFELVSC
jgi:hypothetical protein